LIYDEYLKIDDLKKQLIITPIIQEEYERKIRRNSIELTFPEPFKDTTTYTFNFQDAIQDITEGNVTLDNVLAFSTGDYIDSLYINGKVLDIFSNKPVDDFTVCLYIDGDTNNIFNSPPIYLTKTDKEGKYLIENIKNGTYLLYVYNDANSNLICDMPREMFGFKANSIQLNQNIDSIFLKVQYIDMREIEIQRAGPAGKYYEIKTNKNLLDYDIHPFDGSKTIYHNFANDKKTIRIYDNIHSTDSVQYIFSATDSLDNGMTDTLYLKFIDSKRDKEDFTFSVQPKSGSKISDAFSGRLVFSKPIININFDSLYFKYDSVTYQFLNDTINYTLEKRKDVFTFDIELFFTDYIDSMIKSDTISQSPADKKEGGKKGGKPNPGRTKLIFHVAKSAFISADSDTSKAINLEYQLLQPEGYGTIKGNVLSGYTSFTIQLLDPQNKVIQEVFNENKYECKYVNAGQYHIRVFIDNNNNGKWDPGNIFKNIEPEDVYFFPEKITIRANWELTDIDLTF
jgi:uncharacterized protein (DUF2141 family)